MRQLDRSFCDTGKNGRRVFVILHHHGSAFEGDAVRFIYLEANDAIPKSQITYWQWDFNNDGAVDASGTDPEQIEQTWYAVLDPLRAVNGVQQVSPVLRVIGLRWKLGLRLHHRLADPSLTLEQLLVDQANLVVGHMYNPTTSRSLSMNCGSSDSLNVSASHGS